MDRKPTPFEASSDRRAADLFSRSPEDALAGRKLVSVETDPDQDRSRLVASFAAQEPERFIDLVNYLPHAIQDIFYQFYLLGRTQTQIGELLGMSQTSVWQTLRAGIEGLCAVIAAGGDPTRALDGKAAEAWDRMMKFPVVQGEPLVITEPKNLGRFELRIDDATLELQFAPSAGMAKREC